MDIHTVIDNVMWEVMIWLYGCYSDYHRIYCRIVVSIVIELCFEASTKFWERDIKRISGECTF